VDEIHVRQKLSVMVCTYNPLTKNRKHYKPEEFIAKQLYLYQQAEQKGVRLEAERPKFTWSKIFRVDKSKTLIKEWFGAISGIIITTKAVVANYSNEIIDTINANKSDLSQYLPDASVGVLITVLSFVGLYLRAVTDKDVEAKRDYDD